MFYVYAILSQKVGNWLYIGYSDNLKRRFEEHNKGLVKSTRAYRPLRLVYYEAYISELDARRRERAIKFASQQKEILKKQIQDSLAKRKVP